MRAPRPAAAFRSVLLAALVAASLAGIPSIARATPPSTDHAADHASAGHQLVLHSLSLIGVRYRLGGESPETGLDCSGLVRHVFREVLGFALPRRSEEMSRAGTPVSLDRLQPGDLVFFNTVRRAFSHVGIYIGGNRFVHAPSTGGHVRVESIGTKYWKRRFNGARRVAPEGAPLVVPAVYETTPATRPSMSAAARAATSAGSGTDAGSATSATSAPAAPAAPRATPPQGGVASLLDTIYAY